MRDEGGHLELFEVDDEGIRRLRILRLRDGDRRLRPTVVDGWAAVVDGSGTLHLVPLDAGGEAQEVAEGLGSSPAVVRRPGGGLAVAWTVRSSEPPYRSEARLRGPDGRLGPVQDLTPRGANAVAPAFAPGGNAVFFVDARTGISVLYRANVEPGGFGEAEVARPLMGVSHRAPSLLLVSTAEGLRLAYAAAGFMGTEAVAFTDPVDPDAEPRALVPERGRHALALDHAGRGPNAILLVQAERARRDEAPELRLYRPPFVGAAPVLTMPAPTASPRVAGDAEDFLVLVRQGPRLRAHLGGCDARP
jgi:hypothetical protein